MDDLLILMNSVFSIAYFLAAFIALWISGRIILRNYASENRTTTIFLWLALGGLILTPLFDFLQYLHPVLSLIDTSNWNSVVVSVFLGVGVYLHYSIINLILGITLYSLAIYHGRKMIAKGKLPLIQGLQLGNWELGFVLFGIAGLINQMVSGILFRFVQINLPFLTESQDLEQGLKGFWISWLIGIIILLVTLFIMNELINRREIELLS